MIGDDNENYEHEKCNYENKQDGKILLNKEFKGKIPIHSTS